MVADWVQRVQGRTALRDRRQPLALFLVSKLLPLHVGYPQLRPTEHCPPTISEFASIPSVGAPPRAAAHCTPPIARRNEQPARHNRARAAQSWGNERHAPFRAHHHVHVHESESVSETDRGHEASLYKLLLRKLELVFLVSFVFYFIQPVSVFVFPSRPRHCHETVMTLTANQLCTWMFDFFQNAIGILPSEKENEFKVELEPLLLALLLYEL